MTLLEVILILIQIESGGDTHAIGDGGRAVGVLQIHSCVIEDVNRIYGTTYTLRDRYDKQRSIAIALHYLSHYCTAERIGRQPTPMDAARIWNGGPRGWRRLATKNYENKFIKQLNIKI